MLSRYFRLFSFALSALLLVGTGAWLFVETRLTDGKPLAPAEAFDRGTLGLELMPLKYALVLDEVSGPTFRSGRDAGLSIWRAYGFLDNPRAHLDDKPACVDNALDKLPIGFNLSDRAPVRAFATPTTFVGLTCAACHSANLLLADGREVGPIVGTGNQELDLLAWTDSLRNAVLDPQLSTARILTAYENRCGRPAGLYGSTLGRIFDRIVISAWLAGIRTTVGGDFSRGDLPYLAAAAGSATGAAGPGRTRAFRGIVRIALGVPGADNFAISKIPVVFEQSPKLRPFSQYDGGIGNTTTRALIAAFAAGSSVEALSKPDVARNIARAAAFTEGLGIDVKVPSYRELFPEAAFDPERVKKGFAVYQRECNGCHGNRPAEDRPWSLVGADLIHQIMPVAPDTGTPGIGTDPARVSFRYQDMLPLGIWSAFPQPAGEVVSQRDALSKAILQAEQAGDFARAYLWREKLGELREASRKYPDGHPLAFALADIRSPAGYINNPIPRAFLRAPYLHNGSVPTLKQLINLDPRPAIFCRGENIYDPNALGLLTVLPDSNGQCPSRQSFRFDTGAPGNANKGHDYPWAYDDPKRDAESLGDLLEYLKTL